MSAAAGTGRGGACPGKRDRGRAPPGIERGTGRAAHSAGLWGGRLLAHQLLGMIEVGRVDARLGLGPTGGRRLLLIVGHGDVDVSSGLRADRRVRHGAKIPPPAVG